MTKSIQFLGLFHSQLCQAFHATDGHSNARCWCWSTMDIASSVGSEWMSVASLPRKLSATLLCVKLIEYNPGIHAG